MTETDHERLRALEQAVSEIRVRHAEMEGLIQQTAKTLEQVKADTSEIVELIKGANVLARLVKWVTVVVGGYLTGKGLKWW